MGTDHGRSSAASAYIIIAAHGLEAAYRLNPACQDGSSLVVLQVPLATGSARPSQSIAFHLSSPRPENLFCVADELLKSILSDSCTTMDDGDSLVGQTSYDDHPPELTIHALE